MNTVYLIFQIAIIIFSIKLMIHGFILRKQTKKMIQDLKKQSEERAKRINDFFIDCDNKLEAIKKEYYKACTENEELKERLRNLGIYDFDVMEENHN